MRREGWLAASHSYFALLNRYWESRRECGDHPAIVQRPAGMLTKPDSVPALAVVDNRFRLKGCFAGARFHNSGADTDVEGGLIHFFSGHLSLPKVWQNATLTHNR